MLLLNDCIEFLHWVRYILNLSICHHFWSFRVRVLLFFYIYIKWIKSCWWLLLLLLHQLRLRRRSALLNYWLWLRIKWKRIIWISSWFWLLLLNISSRKIERRIKLKIKALQLWILWGAVVIKIYKIHCRRWGLRSSFNLLNTIFFLVQLRLSYTTRSRCRSRRSKILELVLFLFLFRNLLRFFVSLLALILKCVIPGCRFLMIFKLIISTQSLKPSHKIDI